MEGKKVDSSEELTIWLPSELLSQVSELIADDESLNDLVVGSIAHELERRRGRRAMDDIARIRAKIRQRGASQHDSTTLIRELRDGN
jgi:hypothetical protein